MNEPFLVRIKLNDSIAKKILSFPICSHPQWFHLPSCIVYYLSLLPGLLTLLVPWISKNTESDFSSTSSPCRQRREPLDTCYSFVHSGLWYSQFNGSEECRDYLQATRGFWYSHSFLLYLNMVNLCSIFFIGSIYLSFTYLGLTWPFNHWRCLSLSDVMNQTPQILRFCKTPLLHDLIKMYLHHIFHPRVI